MKADPLKAWLEEMLDLPDFMEFTSVEVNTMGNFGTTSLDVAACRRDHMAMKWLLEAGAEVNACDLEQYTPLHRAARHGHGKSVSLLLDSGASPHLKTRDGQTAVVRKIEEDELKEYLEYSR